MTNIPTDLLRTFVLVVDLRSFTRAAKTQGMTQPAVSAQIRRLQEQLNTDLFDKSAPGVSLTPMGEQVIDFARRLLSINDRIVEIVSPNPAARLVRIGVRKDCMGVELTRMLAETRSRWPDLRFSVLGAGQRRLLTQLKQDQLDLVIALVPQQPEASPRHFWTEELAWVRGPHTEFDATEPIPLVAYGERCLCHRAALEALQEAGLTAELVFRANTAEALRSAVAAGVGVMLLPRSHIPANLEAWDDGPLPPVAPVRGGVFVRAGGVANDLLDQLADHLAEALRPASAETALFTPPRFPAAEAVHHPA
jgi:DNA-binding transcriptional LysR family regulator